MEYKIECSDCLDWLKTIHDGSVDSCVTDPPAGISFMGKKWDHDKGGRDKWIDWFQSVMSEVHRVLKPGGHAVVWALPRTSHWTATGIENAGFEIRDVINHIFGSGFPKSHNVSKAIDKTAGVNEAKQWDGWGTALKPAHENWILARKPFKGTVAANVLEHGTGAINIDESRIDFDDCEREVTPNTTGRWPANLILSDPELLGDKAKYFYCAKSSLSERNAGLDLLSPIVVKKFFGGIGREHSESYSATFVAANNHPTVKPLSLMRYLVKMVTPKNGLCIDPFGGSGTTICSCIGWCSCLACDADASYVEIAQHRISFSHAQQ